MKKPKRWWIWPIASFVAALLAPAILIAVAGKFTGGALLGLAASFPMGLVGLNETWSETTQWFFYYHPMWVSLLATVLAYLLHLAIGMLARRKGLLSFVVLECLIILNGIGLFRMCLLHGLK
jgi:hypothetical protein